jgi:hypothetical protein
MLSCRRTWEMFASSRGLASRASLANWWRRLRVWNHAVKLANYDFTHTGPRSTSGEAAVWTSPACAANGRVLGLTQPATCTIAGPSSWPGRRSTSVLPRAAAV